MAKTTRRVLAPIAPPVTLPSMIPPDVEQKGLRLLAPIKSIEGLEVKTPEDYEQADRLLGNVKRVRHAWQVEMYGADGKSGPIPSIRSGLDQLYALNRKIDGPMEQMETSIKAKMTAFKREELKLLQQAEEVRQAEIRRLKVIEDEAIRKAQEAATPQLKGRLVVQANKAMLAQAVIQEEERVQPIQGYASSTRVKKKWRVANMQAFAAACLDGTFHPEWLEISVVGKAALDAALKEDPDGLAAWPGVETYDDISIVGR